MWSLYQVCQFLKFPNHRLSSIQEETPGSSSEGLLQGMLIVDSGTDKPCFCSEYDQLLRLTAEAYVHVKGSHLPIVASWSEPSSHNAN